MTSHDQFVYYITVHDSYSVSAWMHGRFLISLTAGAKAQLRYQYA